MKSIFSFLVFSLLAVNVHATEYVETQQKQYNFDDCKTTFSCDYRVDEHANSPVTKSLSANIARSFVLKNYSTITESDESLGNNARLYAGYDFANGYRGTILRETKIAQNTDYVDSEVFTGKSIKSAPYKVQFINQGQEEKFGHTPKIKKSFAASDFELTDLATGNVIDQNSSAKDVPKISSPKLTIPKIDYIDNYDNLEDAITKIGSTPTTLTISTPQTLDDGVSLIIPSNLTLWFTDGGLIDGILGGNTEHLILNGYIYAVPHQIFGSNISVKFETGRAIWVDWFGENTNPGITDMTSAILRAFKSTLDTGSKIKFTGTTYIVGDLDLAGKGGITPGNAGPSFVGFGDNSSWAASNSNGGTILKAPAGASYIMKLGNGTNYLYRTSFKDITFDGNLNSSDCVYAESTGFSHFENDVFVDCAGAYVAYRTDRLTMNKVAFYSNKYGFYYDEKIHGKSDALSAISLTDIHHRSNNYNMYLDAERADAQIIVRGGYWASAVYADVFVTGAAKSLIFDGVNFENPSDKNNSHKNAYFQFGQLHEGLHIGIDYVGIKNCLFQDNSPLKKRPIMMTVVDSGDTSNPSISTLEISNNLFFNVASTPLIAKASSLTTELSTKSEVDKAFWIKNSAPTVKPPKSSVIWRETASPSTTGIGNGELNYYNLKNSSIQMPYLNRTSSFVARANESGGFYSNEGATGIVTFTLPAVTVGQAWYFINLEKEVIRIIPQKNEAFTDGSGLGKYKDLSNRVGNATLVIGVSETKSKAWQAIPLNGANLTNE